MRKIQTQKQFKNKISELEYNLFSKLDNVFEEPQINNQNDNETTQQDLLQKAKQRIQQKKDENPAFFEEGRKKLVNTNKKKETFLITAINTMEKKNKPQKVRKEIIDNDEPSCQDLLNDLIAQETRPYDDLAELRKMIADTQVQMNNYVGGMYKLNQNVGKANLEARKIGGGVNDYMLDEIDKKCSKFLIKSRTQTVIKNKKY